MKQSIQFLCAFLLLGPSSLYAAAPTAVNFQGRLTNAGGTSVPDASYSVVFTIYDAASGGISKWTETQSVTTSGGLFAVLLGTVSPVSDTVFNSATRYLGVKVGTDPELTPRTRLVSVPFSERVSTVDGSTGGSISGNINLDVSTATTGNILKGGGPFLHNFGTENLFVGSYAGNLTMSGTQNVGVGADALSRVTSGSYNTVSGVHSLSTNTTGSNNSAYGFDALYSNVTGNYNTAVGLGALYNSYAGQNNTACGQGSLQNNSNGSNNTGCGQYALSTNSTGSNNTAVGWQADVSSGNLTNATAIGNGAIVNVSNKIRFGNAAVMVIEGQVAYTFTSDRNQKENFQPVDCEDVLRKISNFSMTSWNYKKNDPAKFRHYGPMAQEFFAAFGHDALGQCGDSVTMNSGDEAGILFAAVQALEKRTAEIAQVKSENAELKSRNATLETRIERVEAALNKLANIIPANRTQLVSK
jgi:hypothetical protein